MTVTLQVGIVALLVSALVGLVLGYSLPQRQLQQQRKRLKQNQQRLAEMEQAHGERLQAVAAQTTQDHEAQLTQRIAHYQDQLEERIQELNQEHQVQLEMLQQAELATAAPPPPAAPLAANSPEVLRFKQQYEARLKEAAQKLQQAYEQQLAHHTKTTRADLQQVYESRLAQKIEHYEAQLTTRLSQLEEEFATRQATIEQGSGPIAPPNPQSPSAIMGNPNNEPTVTLHPTAAPPPVAAINAANTADSETIALVVPSPSAQPPVEMTAEISRIREDYEAKLAEKIAQYQDRWSVRLAELETEYQSRITTLQQARPAVNPTVIDQLDPLDLGDISQLS